MKSVSVWNPKGGQGKSLLSLNLAACAVNSFDLQPLVIDQDPQGTCRECAKDGRLPFQVIGQIPENKPEGIDLVIIDHQASDWDLPPAKTVVMPVLPTRTQVKTFLRAFTMARDHKKEVIVVVNNVDLNRKQEANAARELRQSGAYVLQKGSPFGHAEAELATIFDDSIPAIRDGYKVKERRAEIEAILVAILREETKR
jgi:chromosome partitioning protein